MSSDTYRGELRRVTLGPEVRALRAQATPAEQRLWEVVRARRLAGWKFRRQHQHGPFVLDFYCPAARLAVEADGASHASPESRDRDRARTAYLASHGVRVLRFANDQIIHQLDEVRATLLAALASPLPLPPSHERSPEANHLPSPHGSRAGDEGDHQPTKPPPQ